MVVYSYGAQHELLRLVLVLLMNSDVKYRLHGVCANFCTSELVRFVKNRVDTPITVHIKLIDRMSFTIILRKLYSRFIGLEGWDPYNSRYIPIGYSRKLQHYSKHFEYLLLTLPKFAGA